MKKVLKIILITFLVVIVGAFAFFKWIAATNTIEHGSKEVKLSAASDNKALVIYQPSRGSLTKDMATFAANALHKEGYDVTVNYPSKELTYNAADYQVIIFATPLYFDTYSKVLEDYMKQIKDYTGKRVMILATGGTKEASKTLGKLEDIVKAAKKKTCIKLLKGEEAVLEKEVGILLQK